MAVWVREWELLADSYPRWQLGGTCTSVGTAVPGISQQPPYKALIYTDVLTEALSVQISTRNAADYQVNFVLRYPYSWALSNVYIHTNLGS
jgi:hypothetical protein